jgi:hypothetical protein
MKAEVRRQMAEGAKAFSLSFLSVPNGCFIYAVLY